MTDDVVEELEHWLRGSVQAEPHLILRRARDEIVALRRTIMLGPDLPALAREQALEEAAQRCDRLGTDYTIPMSADNWSAGCRGCAGRIRALKGKAR